MANEFLKIKKVSWQEHANQRTLKEFNDGASKVSYLPVITCELPKDFAIFEKDARPEVYIFKDRKAIALEMVGYNISNQEVIFSPLKAFESEFKIKVFSL